MAAPYDRLKAESDQSFAAFVVYRSLGSDRSTAKAALELGKSKALLDRWCSKHKWVKRCAAWDAHVDQRLREAETRELEKMRARQISLASSLQGLGATELRKALSKANSNPSGTVSIKELIALIETGTKLERVNRGEPGEIVGHRDEEVDLTALSMEELKALKGMHQKLKAG
jgi:hypothetical protein